MYFRYAKVHIFLITTKNFTKIICLNGCDLRDKVWHDLQPNGFTEPRLFNAHAEHTRNRQTADESSLPV